MKVKRKVPFKKLPDADPLQTPTSSGKARLGEEAAAALLPAWYQPEPKAATDDGDAAPRSSADDKAWEAFVDRQPEQPEATSPRGVTEIAKKRSVIDVLASERSESPHAIAGETRRRVVGRPETLKDVPHGTSLERLQSIGRRLAARRGATNPAFETAKAEGLAAKDWPPPGTSFGMFGFRGSTGRSMTTVSQVEADRLYHDPQARRHGTSVNNLQSAPLDAQSARQMEPGERYRIYGERATLVDAGVRYTWAPLGLLQSNPLWDFGPYGEGEAVVALEGDSVIEIVGGPDQTVGLTIALGKKKQEPIADGKTDKFVKKDGGFRVGAGLFVDGSVGDLFFSKLAEDQVAAELDDVDKQKRELDLAVTPHLRKLNRTLDASFAVESHKTKESVTAYEMTFDLANPKAREIFDKVVGANEDGVVDFSALEALDPKTSGVDVVANHVRRASRKGFERTFRFFGYEAHQQRVTETIDTTNTSASAGKVTARQENHGIVTRRRKLTRSASSTLVARVKAEHREKDGEKRSGVGLGWRLAIDDSHTSVDEAVQILALASVAEPGGVATEKLRELRDRAAELPRSKMLGLPVGARGIGSSFAQLSVDLNARAVRTLLEHVGSTEKRGALWDRLAEAYRVRHGLEVAPKWPKSSLNGDGWFAAVRRGLAKIGVGDDAFLVARNMMTLLERAAKAEEPVERGKLLVQAFDAVSTDLYLAGALIDIARGHERSLVQLDFELDGDGLSTTEKPKIVEAEDEARPELDVVDAPPSDTKAIVSGDPTEPPTLADPRKKSEAERLAERAANIAANGRR